MTDLKDENLELKLKGSVWSQMKNGTIKGLKISYGLAVAVGIAYIFVSDIKGCIEADQSQACQEMPCSPTFNESCYKRITTKENADHCIINDEGGEECCMCSCYWNNI